MSALFDCSLQGRLAVRSKLTGIPLTYFMFVTQISNRSLKSAPSPVLLLIICDSEGRPGFKCVRKALLSLSNRYLEKGSYNNKDIINYCQIQIPSSGQCSVRIGHHFMHKHFHKNICVPINNLPFQKVLLVLLDIHQLFTI